MWRSRNIFHNRPTSLFFGLRSSPALIVAADQDTDTIVTFRIDPQTGNVLPTGHARQVPTPVCVKFPSGGGR